MLERAEPAVQPASSLRSALRRLTERLADRSARLPLFWKLLLPGFVIVLVLGISAVVLSARFLASRIQSDLDERLFRSSVDAEADVRDAYVELYGAGRTVANLQGVAESITGDPRTVQESLVGLAAVSGGVDLLVLTDRQGTGLVEVVREGAGFGLASGRPWADEEPVRRVLDGVEPADGVAGFVQLNGDSTLVAVVPVRNGEVVGTGVVGIRAERVATSSAARIGGSVALFDLQGRRVAAAGSVAPAAVPAEHAGGEPLRVQDEVEGTGRAMAFDTMELAGTRVGDIAVALEQSSVADSVRGTALWLALIALLAMITLGGIAAMVARVVTRQVRELAEVSRELGRGHLSARASLSGGDELGELARRLNDMADQLQAAQAEIELRVAARTEELRRLHRESTDAAEGQAEALAQITHELRNPIFAVVAHAELLLDPKFSPDAPKWVREYGEIIREAGHDMLRQVDQILEASRLQHVPVELKLTDVSLGRVLRDMEPTMRALARRADLSFGLDVPAPLPSVTADPDRVREIVLNLVSNAVKYTPPGGRVEVVAARHDGAVSLAVRDTGVGIPPDALERLFEPFYRVEGTTAQRGEPSTGLGLAITERLVNAHGGSITVESSPGHGSSFTVRFSTAAKSRRQAGSRSRAATSS